MTSFIHKKLSTGKTLPEIFSEEREKLNLSLDEVSLGTQISLNYLKDLEKGNYGRLPGDVYTKQFIKRLAKYFKFSEKNLLEIYQHERETQLSFFQPKPLVMPKKHLLTFLTPKMLKISLITILISGMAGYLGWEVKNIFTPPFLLIESPASQTITQDSTIAIKGKALPESTVAINDQEILTRPDGTFLQKVDLNIGLNLFKITASKKHSQPKLVNLSILRQPGSENANAVDKSVSVN